MTKVGKLKKIFYPLLHKSRIDPSGKLKFDVAMKIQACPMHESKYKTPMAPLTFVTKEDGLKLAAWINSLKE